MERRARKRPGWGSREGRRIQCLDLCLRFWHTRNSARCGRSRTNAIPAKCCPCSITVFSTPSSVSEIRPAPRGKCGENEFCQTRVDESMNHVAHYERLIARARSRSLIGYREPHHVVPK